MTRLHTLRFTRAAAGRDPHLPVAVLLALAGCLALAATTYADVHVDAYDLERGVPLFRGSIAETRDDGTVARRTVFARTDGTVLQTIETTYDDESLRVIRYRLEDPRSGEIESIAASGESLVMAYRESATDGESSDTLPRDAAQTCTDLLAERIRRALDGLRRGETLVVALLVPSRLGTVEFRAQGEGTTNLDGRPAVVVRAEPAFWLFRMMVAPLRFVYAAEPPYELLEYRGRSSVKTDGGDPIVVRLVYRPGGAG